MFTERPLIRSTTSLFDEVDPGLAVGSVSKLKLAERIGDFLLYKIEEPARKCPGAPTLYSNVAWQK